jgi:hypothetical protein
VADSGGDRPDVAGVLANRLAATLAHHEPGWRLPRPSALARRYNVRPALVEQAVRDLTARHLIRQLPDGQLYRAGPVEYQIPVQGVPRLGAFVDPMGSVVTCRSRRVSWRRVPEDIGSALGLAPADSACTIKCHWAVNNEPAAISTTYLTAESARVIGADSAWADAALPIAHSLTPLPLSSPGAAAPGTAAALLGVPAAVHLELQPPPPSVARVLRLGAGQTAAMVTVRFDEPDAGRPVALTVAALRADLFRIVVETPSAIAVTADAGLEPLDAEPADTESVDGVATIHHG